MALFAGALARLGVGKGDRVIIYMPMIPEAVDRHAGLRAHRRGPLGGLRRLRRQRAGDAHRRRQAEGDRLRVLRHRAGAQSSPTSRCSTRRSSWRATSPSAASSCSGRSRPATLQPGRDVDWHEAVADGRSPPTACRSRPPIRSTSSTPPAPPAQPKGVVRDNGGHAVALKWTHEEHLRRRAGRGLLGRLRRRLGGRATPTSSTAPLLNGCTTILYEGKPVGTPDAGAFWRVIAAARRATSLFTAPTAFRAIKQRGPGRRAASATYDLSRFRALFLAGERCDPDTLHWAERSCWTCR